MNRFCPILFFTVAFVSFFVCAQMTSAATLTTVSDLISTSRPTSPAMHIITFTTVTMIPSSGKIIITFPQLSPNDSNNPASPSASTFQTNGLSQGSFKIYDVTATADITSNFTANGGAINITNPTTAGTSPIFTLVQGTTTTITGGHTLKIFIGCTALSGNGSTVYCSAQTPRLLNPTKTAPAGVANSWRISLATQNASGTQMDAATARIATIEGVSLKATIAPTLTFTITGLSGSSNLNMHIQNTNCGADTLNTGIDASATAVNLGTLAVGSISISGQELSVSTNAQNGYVITAIASGKFSDPSTGASIPDNAANGLLADDTPPPAAFGQNGTAYWGIHACGISAQAVNADQWASAGQTTFSGAARYANPWNTGTNGFVSTIASYTLGPVNDDKTEVEYAATISPDTQAGTYSTNITYTATPSF